MSVGRSNGKSASGGTHALTVRLPVDLNVRVVSMANATDVSVQEFVSTALSSHLARRSVQISSSQRRAYLSLVASRKMAR